MIRLLISDPRQFFERRASTRRLRWEIILLLLIGGLGAAGWAWLSLTFLGAVAGDRDQLRLLLVGKSLYVLVTPLILWIGYAVVLHVLANLFQTRGQFSRILKVTAWAFVPLAVVNVVRSGALFLAFSDESLPEDPEGLSANAVFDTLWNLGASDTPMLLYHIVFIIVVLTIGYLLLLALQEVRDVSTAQARQIVAIPVGVHILYLVWKTLTTAGLL